MVGRCVGRGSTGELRVDTRFSSRTNLFTNLTMGSMLLGDLMRTRQ